MNRRSMKTRMTLWITLIGVVLVTFFGVLSYFAGGLISDAGLRRDLQTAVLAESKRLDGSEEIPGSLTESGEICLILTDEDGKWLSGRVQIGLDGFPTPDSKTHVVVEAKGERYFVYDKKTDIGGEKRFVRGIVPAPDKGTVYGNVLKSALFMLPLFAILLAICSYLVVRQSLLGLGRLITCTSAIMDGKDLSRSIPVGKKKDEISELTETVNAMLDRLEESFADEKRFVSDASHELKTPTAAILAQCQLLEAEDAPTHEDYRKGIATVHRQADRMNRLITELLAYSGIDRNRPEKVFRMTDVSELLEKICTEQREINGESVRLDCRCEQRIMAEVNESLFTRLLSNLISNAYQYTNDGGQIEVSLTESQGVDLRPLLVLSVKDNGIGIPKEEQGKIWERFYRVDSVHADKGCSGLGLPMVKWIVGYHGGSVRLVSAPGKGSEFIVEIPQRQ